MALRPGLLAVFVLAECACAYGGMVATRGLDPTQWFAPRPQLPGADLDEGGAHKIFPAGPHPTVSVAIGNADLTIQTGDASTFDVSASKSSDFGFMREQAPIAAHVDGSDLQVALTYTSDWKRGDDRMVTLVVPPATRVTVTSAGDVRATGLRAEASVDSDDGYVIVEDYEAPQLRVKTSSERIELHRVLAQDLDVSSGDRVVAEGLAARDGSIEADGRVTLNFAPASDSLVTAQTSDGKIELSNLTALPTTVAPRKPDDDDDDSAVQSVRVGDGAGRLAIHSSDGNIYLSE